MVTLRASHHATPSFCIISQQPNTNSIYSHFTHTAFIIMTPSKQTQLYLDSTLTRLHAHTWVIELAILCR